MVATQFDSSTSCRRFMVRPNCSLSWRDALRFYLGMILVSFGIATGFALQGAWLVLPFAGLEMLVLGAALYVVGRRCARWQLVSVCEDAVEIVAADAGVIRHRFSRAWARVELVRPAIKGHPSRLLIGSHGRAVEVGGCLNEEEKCDLARQLRLAVATA